MKFIKISGAANYNLVRPVGKDVIWVRFFRKGKGRLERSLKTNAISQARINRDIEIAKFLGTKASFQSKMSLVEDKFPEFLELKKIKSKGTYDSMKNQWENHLKAYFGGMLLDEVTNTEWLKYVAQKRISQPNRKFFNDRKYLSMFIHWLHRDGVIEKLVKLDDVDPEIKAGKVFTDDEIAELFKYAGDDLHLQIMMALTMGMRVGEILSLEWSQINWNDRSIYLPAEKTKIRKERTFGLSSATAKILLKRHSKHISEWVFPSPTDPSKSVGKGGNKTAWRACKKLAGVEGRFHDLRHTFLTRAFKKSVNPALICHYAGLSLEEAQKTYLHFTHEDTRMVSELVEVLS